MSRVVVLDSFDEDLEHVTSARVYNAILDAVESLEQFPQRGSISIPKSIKSKYGTRVRKIVVNPFDVVYSYDSQDDIVIVMGLVHQRNAS